MKKILCLFLFTVLVSSLFFISCSKDQETAAAEDKNQVVQEKNDEAEKTSEAIVLIDALGREYSPASKIESVVPLDYSFAEIICLAGGKDKITGLGRIRESSSILQRYLPEQAELPVTGRKNSLNIEKLLSINPDLVLCGSYSSVVDLIDENGISVFALPLSSTIQECIDYIELVGQCIGNGKEAEVLTSYLYETLNKIEEKIKNINDSEKPGVYYARDSIYETMDNDFQSGVIALAGGKNTAAVSGSGNFTIEVSRENIYEWNPDIIIIRANSPLTVDEVYSDRELANLNAVMNKKVFKLKYAQAEYGLEVVFGILEKALIFHPGIFKDMDLENIVEGFYEKVDSFYTD